MSTDDRPAGTQAHDWLDQEAGPLVRSFALTGGRTSPGAGRFDLITYVVAVAQPSPDAMAQLQPEHLTIMDRVRNPASVAEIASHLSRSLGVVRVLLSDLEGLGVITRFAPAQTASRPDDHILQAVIDGLRAAG